LLATFSTWDNQELEALLKERVQASRLAVEKILEAFKELRKQHEMMMATQPQLLSSSKTGASTLDNGLRDPNVQLARQNQKVHALIKELHEKYQQMMLEAISYVDYIGVYFLTNRNFTIPNKVLLLSYLLICT